MKSNSQTLLCLSSGVSISVSVSFSQSISYSVSLVEDPSHPGRFIVIHVSSLVYHQITSLVLVGLEEQEDDEFPLLKVILISSGIVIFVLLVCFSIFFILKRTQGLKEAIPHESELNAQKPINPVEWGVVNIQIREDHEKDELADDDWLNEN